MTKYAKILALLLLIFLLVGCAEAPEVPALEDPASDGFAISGPETSTWDGLQVDIGALEEDKPRTDTESGVRLCSAVLRAYTFYRDNFKTAETPNAVKEQMMTEANILAIAYNQFIEKNPHVLEAAEGNLPPGLNTLKMASEV